MKKQFRVLSVLLSAALLFLCFAVNAYAYSSTKLDTIMSTFADEQPEYTPVAGKWVVSPECSEDPKDMTSGNIDIFIGANKDNPKVSAIERLNFYDGLLKELLVTAENESDIIIPSDYRLGEVIISPYYDFYEGYINDKQGDAVYSMSFLLVKCKDLDAQSGFNTLMAKIHDVRNYSKETFRGVNYLKLQPSEVSFESIMELYEDIKEYHKDDFTDVYFVKPQPVPKKSDGKIRVTVEKTSKPLPAYQDICPRQSIEHHLSHDHEAIERS